MFAPKVVLQWWATEEELMANQNNLLIKRMRALGAEGSELPVQNTTEPWPGLELGLHTQGLLWSMSLQQSSDKREVLCQNLNQQPTHWWGWWVEAPELTSKFFLSPMFPNSHIKHGTQKSSQNPNSIPRSLTRPFADLSESLSVLYCFTLWTCPRGVPFVSCPESLPLASQIQMPKEIKNIIFY